MSSQYRASLRDRPAWPSHYGTRRMRRNNLIGDLIAIDDRTKTTSELTPSVVLRRTSFHRRRNLLSPFALVTLVANYAATGKLSRVQQNSVPSLHMRCMITASRRANATTAFCLPRRLAIFIAHAFSHDHFLTFTSRTCAASYSRDRIIASPQQDTRPTRLLSPDSFSFGVSPSTEPTAFECANRPGISMVAV